MDIPELSSTGQVIFERSRSMNHFCFVGNLSKDAEVKTSQAGKPFTRFSVAVNDSYKDIKGNWIKEVSYFDCVSFSEYVSKLGLKKGDKVCIDGKVKQNKWQGQDGKTHYAVSFTVDHLTKGERAESKPQAGQGAGIQESPESFQEDIPF